MDRVWRSGARAGNPMKTVQVFSKRIKAFGVSANYTLVIDTAGNRVVSFFPALGGG